MLIYFDIAMRIRFEEYTDPSMTQVNDVASVELLMRLSSLDLHKRSVEKLKICCQQFRMS